MAQRRFKLINSAAAAASETNDLSSVVTWANVPDVNITESSVTQHQAALSITESQISDLQAYLLTVVVGDINAAASTDGWVITSDGAGNAAWEVIPAAGAEVNDLSAAVTWVNIPIANVPTGSTGSTVSLGNHTHDSITDTNLVDKSAAEAVSGEWSVPSIIRGKTTDYTMVLGDAGQTVRTTGSTAAQTITIPANASVAYPIGTLICIENDSSVDWSLAITTDTMTWSADNTTGTRTLGAGASAVIHKTTATTWKVAGSALVT